VLDRTIDNPLYASYPLFLQTGGIPVLFAYADEVLKQRPRRETSDQAWLQRHGPRP
jgi:hypothetical protein